MRNYRDLKVWEKAHRLTLDIYKATTKFPKEEQYNLTSQIRRASVSIPTNIAEGSGKNSNLDLARFLQISFGSTHEVEYLIFLSFELAFLDNNEFTKLNSDIGEIKAMLISLIKKVRSA